MTLRLKKYISILFLLAFLYPQVIEVVHQYQHRNDKHCTERNIVHFHETEHHCAICDYVPAPSDKPTLQTFVSFVPHISQNYIHFYQTASFEQNKFNFSLRGPPTVS